MIVHAIAGEPVSADVLRPLAGAGHELRLHRLDLPEPGGPSNNPSAWTRGARSLIDDLAHAPAGEGEDGPGVLHALDPSAWLAATAARRVLTMPLVLRVADRLPLGRARRNPVLLECLRQADGVAVNSLGLRRELMHRGVRGDRIQVVPEVGTPFVAATTDPPLRRRVVVLDDGHRQSDDLRRLRSAGSFLVRADLDVRFADDRAGALERVELMDGADVVVCGAEADHDAVQAMWRGRAVVAPETPAMAEVVLDRHTGRLFRPGDHEDLLRVLTRVATSPFSVQAQGLAARHCAESRYGAIPLARTFDRLYTQAGARA